MFNINTFLFEFAAAWTMFIRLPLPVFLQGDPSRSQPLDGPGTLIRPRLPLIGLVLGLFIVVPLWVLALLPNGKVTASLAGAVIAPLFLEMALGWEELNALATKLYWEAQGLIDRANSLESKAETIRRYLDLIEK